MREKISMRRQRMGLFAAATVIIMTLAPAHADTLENFTFSGNLGTPYNGGSSVTGTFTLDTTNTTITAFDFTTPVVTIDTVAGWSALLTTFTPAYSPDADFIRLYFADFDQDHLTLLFQTTLASFTGGPLYTSLVYPNNFSNTDSNLDCDGLITECDLYSGYGSLFSSGTAALLSPTPLPAAFPLFAGGLGLLSLFGWRRGRRPAIRATLPC